VALEVTHVERRSQSRNNNSSSNNSSRNSLQTCLPNAANQATGHPSLSQQNPPAANPANRDQMNTANQETDDNCQAYRQHHGTQWKSLKADIISKM
jgi:hypothetical protein